MWPCNRALSHPQGTSSKYHSMPADRCDNNFRPHQALAIICYPQKQPHCLAKRRMSNTLLSVQLLNIQDETYRAMLSVENRTYYVFVGHTSSCQVIKQ